MHSKIKLLLSLLDSQSRIKLFIYSLLRMLIGMIDIVGVLLIGLILAKSVNSVGAGSAGTSKVSKYLEIFDAFTIFQLALIATFAFITKSALSAILTKIMLQDFANFEVKIATGAFDFMLKNISWTTKAYSKSDINFLLKSSTGSTVQMIAAFVVVISELFFLIAILISFLFVDSKITLFIVLYFSLIAIFLNNYLGKRFKAAGIKSVTNEVAATTVIYDTIQSYREVVSLKKQNYFLNKFKDHKYNVAKASFDIQFLSALPRYIVESSLLIGALGIISLSLSSGNIGQSAESIGIFLTGSMKIMTSLLPLQTYFAQFKNQIEISQKFLDFEQNAKAMKSSKTLVKPSKPKASHLRQKPIGVSIENLFFDYGDSQNPVLSDLTLRIKPGEQVAFIGSSGAGKSTLADLIIGINKPGRGAISYFTSDDENIDPEEINFGYVPQNPGRIYGTIKENIAFGVPVNEIQIENLEEAITISCLNDVISQLDQGYETHTGEQSDDLSGGQMQRIGLARALYVRPNLLILDEATSALDVENEMAISRSLENLRGTCTVIVIAHRLSTVKNSDTVFVMDNGKIVAQGKFSELADSNEIVARFVELSNLI